MNEKRGWVSVRWDSGRFDPLIYTGMGKEYLIKLRPKSLLDNFRNVKAPGKERMQVSTSFTPSFATRSTIRFTKAPGKDRMQALSVEEGGDESGVTVAFRAPPRMLTYADVC